MRLPISPWRPIDLSPLACPGKILSKLWIDMNVHASRNMDTFTVAMGCVRVWTLLSTTQNNIPVRALSVLGFETPDLALVGSVSFSTLPNRRPHIRSRSSPSSTRHHHSSQGCFQSRSFTPQTSATQLLPAHRDLPLTLTTYTTIPSNNPKMLSTSFLLLCGITPKHYTYRTIPR